MALAASTGGADPVGDLIQEDAAQQRSGAIKAGPFDRYPLTVARRLFRIVLGGLRRTSSCGFHPCFRHVSAIEVLLAGTYWKRLSRIERDGFIDYLQISATRPASAQSPCRGSMPGRFPSVREQLGKTWIGKPMSEGSSVGLFTAVDEHLTLFGSASIRTCSVRESHRICHRE